MRKIYLSSFLSLILTGLFIVSGTSNAEAQIKIGTNGATIAPSSLLELESANQGLLLPRMADTVAINALNPPNGMLIYLTKTPAVGLYVRKVTGWEYLTGSLGGVGNFTSLNVSGTVTAGSFSGPLNGNATSANTATNATNSLNSTVINDLSTTLPVYPTFVNTTPGNSQLRTSTTKLSFVPNTGILTATGFSGPLTGDVTGNATSATNATNASNTDIVNEVVSAAVHYPTFVSGTSGNLPQLVSNPGLNYVPSTGTLSATRFSGPLTGNATTATAAINSTNSANSFISNDVSTTTVTYPVFVAGSTGNLGLRTGNANLSYVPSTGVLTALGFRGPLTGNVTGIATQATDAVNAANTAITNNITTNALYYPTFVSGTAGNLAHQTSGPNLTFNPNTGILSATTFNGNLTGNSTTATNATTTTITDDIATAATVYPTFVTNTSGNLGQRTAGLKLTFVPSTGVLSSTSFTSTVPNGTAPLVVASSTTVANLTSTNSVNVGITNDVGTSLPVYPTFVTGTTSFLDQRVSNSRLSFIPSSGQLSATSYVGLWNGGIILGQYGGTGINNSGRTIQLAGNLTTFGGHNITFRTNGLTDVTLPTNGTLVTAISNNEILDFPLTPAQSSSDLVMTVLFAGAGDSDVVSIGVPNIAIVPNGTFSAWVSAPNVVTVRYSNYGATAQNPLSGNFQVKIFK